MTPCLTVAIVDDEPGLRLMIEDYLTLQGCEVIPCANGAELDHLLQRIQPDIIVLDVNMPGEDGLSILSRLRRSGARMGIIMLTANAGETSRLEGLDEGADDYIVKPFALAGLLARLRAVQRRLPTDLQPRARRRPEVSFGPFRLDLDGRQMLDPAGRVVGLSTMEFDLIEVFARHPNQILTRDRLCELAHGRPLEPGDRSVDIRITRLRKKIEADPACPLLLCTVRGEGYRFDPGPAATTG